MPAMVHSSDPQRMALTPLSPECGRIAGRSVVASETCSHGKTPAVTQILQFGAMTTSHELRELNRTGFNVEQLTIPPCRAALNKGVSGICSC